MSEAWVLNASALILFSRSGRLDLIERLAPAILTPNAVIEEVRAGRHKDPTAAAALEWAERYVVEDQRQPSSSTPKLKAGLSAHRTPAGVLLGRLSGCCEQCRPCTVISLRSPSTRIMKEL